MNVILISRLQQTNFLCSVLALEDLEYIAQFILL